MSLPTQKYVIIIYVYWPIKRELKERNSCHDYLIKEHFYPSKYKISLRKDLTQKQSILIRKFEFWKFHYIVPIFSQVTPDSAKLCQGAEFNNFWPLRHRVNLVGIQRPLYLVPKTNNTPSSNLASSLHKHLFLKNYADLFPSQLLVSSISHALPLSSARVNSPSTIQLRVCLSFRLFSPFSSSPHPTYPFIRVFWTTHLSLIEYSFTLCMLSTDLAKSFFFRF